MYSLLLRVMTCPSFASSFFFLGAIRSLLLVVVEPQRKAGSVNRSEHHCEDEYGRGKPFVGPINLDDHRVVLQEAPA